MPKVFFVIVVRYIKYGWTIDDFLLIDLLLLALIVTWDDNRCFLMHYPSYSLLIILEKYFKRNDIKSIHKKVYTWINLQTLIH